MNKKSLLVADFFCGAGGFSEGFRLNNFKVIFALDNWSQARITHSLNHPHCIHPGLDSNIETNGDILKIDILKIDEIIPDTEIITGSPPCVSFSNSNKAGKANKSLGIKLITKFLQIIAIKKYKPNSILKYWLMENVPNSRKYLKNEYTFRNLGINNKILKLYSINKDENEIALKIDTSENKVYNSADFCVPQRRLRFITGEFPEPKKICNSDSKWISLGSVISSLSINEGEITDPNFHDLKIKNEELTDHFYNTEIHEFNWKQAKIAKQQARFYGKMSFPENYEQPSRTIMATKSVRSRESLILKGKGKNKYRIPTIREIASLMSFPISYQFEGKTEEVKYRLVGNAVCPKMICAFSEAILKDLKIKKTKKTFRKSYTKLENDFRINPPKNKIPNGRNKNCGFASIVPDIKFDNFRVELDNNFPAKSNQLKWNVSIHHATGKDSMKMAKPTLKNIEELFKKNNLNNKFIKFAHEFCDKNKNCLPNNSLILQKLYCQVTNNTKKYSPTDLLDKLSIKILEEFPLKKYKSAKLENIDNLIIFNKRTETMTKIPLLHLIALYTLLLIFNKVK